MRINFLTSNVLHQVLDKDINIIYNSTHNVFDKIVYTIDANFFNFSSQKSYDNNLRNLQNSHIDLYNYDLYVDNGIINYKQNSNITKSLHINPLIFEHNNKNNQLKKEDVAILNNQLSRIKKIFFNENYAKSWNLSNSLIIEYGIPLDIFKPLNLTDKKTFLLYYGSNRIIGQQTKDYLKADVIENIHEKSIEEINQIFNEYEVFIDITNTLCTDLAALSSGCKVMSLSDCHKSIPGMYFYSSIEDIINNASQITNIEISYEKVHRYIEENYSYNLFKEKLYSIINHTAKREAYIA